MSPTAIDPQPAPPFDPAAIQRPHPRLLEYYTVLAAFTLLGFPFVFLARYVRYKTLRYRFDDEGVWMAWGLLWRREINLTYRRIQDIHLTRNLVQRWMGLATVSVQTASGSATPEMSIEGVLEAEALRDYLYQQMRGARGLDAPGMRPGADGDHGLSPRPADEALALLTEIRDALAAAATRTTGGRP